MLISLIMVTINKVQEVEIFLESLNSQTYRDFELIVVDQNADDRLASFIEKYSQMYKIVYIKSNVPGISKNRNIGLEHVHGDVIAFPDDDCEYKNDTLQVVYNFFINNQYDFFTFAYEDKVLHLQMLKKKSCNVSYRNIFGCAISITIFAKKDCLIGFKFDELMGVGAKYGSGEESDMILYFFSNKKTGYYNGFYTIYHPKKDNALNNAAACLRVYNYALGFGALHKKAVVQYKSYYYFFRFIYRILINVIAVIISPYKKYYFNGLKGKIKGFYLYKFRKPTS